MHAHENTCSLSTRALKPIGILNKDKIGCLTGKSEPSLGQNKRFLLSGGAYVWFGGCFWRSREALTLVCYGASRYIEWETRQQAVSGGSGCMKDGDFHGSFLGAHAALSDLVHDDENDKSMCRRDDDAYHM